LPLAVLMAFPGPATATAASIDASTPELMIPYVLPAT
jgi:hypothetical protein